MKARAEGRVERERARTMCPYICDRGPPHAGACVFVTLCTSAYDYAVDLARNGPNW